MISEGKTDRLNIFFDYPNRVELINWKPKTKGGSKIKTRLIQDMFGKPVNQGVEIALNNGWCGLAASLWIETGYASESFKMFYLTQDAYKYLISEGKTDRLNIFFNLPKYIISWLKTQNKKGWKMKTKLLQDMNGKVDQGAEIAFNNGWFILAASLWIESGNSSENFQNFYLTQDLSSLAQESRLMHSLPHFICDRCGEVSWSSKVCQHC